jgi:hypothetical protein
VVVGVSGSLVLQAGGQPTTQQLDAQFLVKKDQDGLRVAGMYSKATSMASAQAMEPQAPVVQGY